MYRFGQAAIAIGIPEASLRNWMTRNKLDLFDARPDRGWRTFTENDVYILAMARELVKFGVPVKSAVDAVRIGLGGTNFETWDGLPTFLFAAPDHADEWVCDQDEGLVLTVTGSATVAKVAVPIVLAAARRRLSTAA